MKEFCYEPQGLAVHDGMGQFEEDDYEDWEKTEPNFSEDTRGPAAKAGLRTGCSCYWGSRLLPVSGWSRGLDLRG